MSLYPTVMPFEPVSLGRFTTIYEAINERRVLVGLSELDPQEALRPVKGTGAPEIAIAVRNLSTYFVYITDPSPPPGPGPFWLPYDWANAAFHDIDEEPDTDLVYRGYLTADWFNWLSDALPQLTKIAIEPIDTLGQIKTMDSYDSEVWPVWPAWSTDAPAGLGEVWITMQGRLNNLETRTSRRLKWQYPTPAGVPEYITAWLYIQTIDFPGTAGPAQNSGYTLDASNIIFNQVVVDGDGWTDWAADPTGATPPPNRPNWYPSGPDPDLGWYGWGHQAYAECSNLLTHV